MGKHLRYMYAKSFNEVVEAFLNPNVPHRCAMGEIVSVLMELAHESETYCIAHPFISKVAAAIATILGVARESGEPLRTRLAEKAAEALAVALETMDELKRDRLSCVALEAGFRRIDDILRSADNIISTLRTSNRT